MMKSRRMGWPRDVAPIGGGGDTISAFRIFVGKPEEGRPLGRP
jgi:hypothetical protein